MSERRLSQAIAEGDGISVLVEVGDGDAGRSAAVQGAEGVVLRGTTSLAGSVLPVLAYGPTPDDAAKLGADAVVVSLELEDEALDALAHRATALGLECVLRVRDEDDVERALEHLDPEVFLLAVDDRSDEATGLERLLELLPDVPAGKLAIAELVGATRADVEALERAVVDAVVVTGDVADLVGVVPPEV
ncbi:MAG: hypothetical protein ACR2HI_06800 [Gaiella sp.]